MADLVTSSQVLAAWPGFAKLDSGEQSALVTQASRAVEEWCKRTFAVATYTDYLNGKNRSRVWLRNLPVISITSVTANGTLIDNTGGNAYLFVPETGALIRGTNMDDPQQGPWWPWGTRNIVVVYSAGYASVPDTVQRATILTIKNLYEVLKTSVGPVQSEKIGDYQYTLATPSYQAVPPIAAGLLANYVLDPIA